MEKNLQETLPPTTLKAGAERAGSGEKATVENFEDISPTLSDEEAQQNGQVISPPNFERFGSTQADKSDPRWARDGFSL